MLRVRRGHVHRLNFAIREQRFVRAVRPRDAVFAGKLVGGRLRPAAHGCQSPGLRGEDAPREDAGDPPGTQDAPAKIGHD